MKSDRDRCIALAGMFQAANLVSDIAYSGSCEQEAARASIHSLFQVDAESVLAVYGGQEGISTGLNQLIGQLSGKEQRNTETTGYVITMMHLERKLSKQPQLLEIISDGIQLATSRLEHFPMLHQNILGQLADIYSQTLSTMQPRIMVNGEPLHLQNSDNTNYIRSLLLAGIRSAMLWHQCGGKRLQIIMSRQKIINTAISIRNNIEKSRH
ncbi:MAG: high frequency lysogenization protein HflD [Gammaproteobacteria bacterium]|nr:high frequency lysogenization protein HflD [Gammaproteobacteria bacterium]